MTKEFMIDQILADMKSDIQRENFKKRGMKKSKEFIERVYLDWCGDKDNGQFYRAIINK